MNVFDHDDACKLMTRRPTRVLHKYYKLHRMTVDNRNDAMDIALVLRPPFLSDIHMLTFHHDNTVTTKLQASTFCKYGKLLSLTAHRYTPFWVTRMKKSVYGVLSRKLFNTLKACVLNDQDFNFVGPLAGERRAALDKLRASFRPLTAVQRSLAPVYPDMTPFFSEYKNGMTFTASGVCDNETLPEHLPMGLRIRRDVQLEWRNKITQIRRVIRTTGLLGGFVDVERPYAPGIVLRGAAQSHLLREMLVADIRQGFLRQETLCLLVSLYRLYAAPRSAITTSVEQQRIAEYILKYLDSNSFELRKLFGVYVLDEPVDTSTPTP